MSSGSCRSLQRVSLQPGSGTPLYPNGERAYMSGGPAKQMRRMASEGHWGVLQIRKRLRRRRTW
jgi:hypothetical protein